MTALLLTVTVISFYAMAIVSAIEAVITVRTAQGASAWVVSLITLPYIAVPLYFVFGRNRFEGYFEQREHIERESAKLSEETRSAVGRHIVRADDLPLYRSLFRLARLPATRGNHVSLLVNGRATFDSILAGLREAERYILFQFYIIRDDGLGGEIGDVLCERARNGVKVFLLYDEIGSPRFPRTRLFKRLKDCGVELAAFDTTQGRRNRFQLNFRNHRKVVVVDGRAAWIGGHNVGDEYLGITPHRGPWRDTHLKLEGPAVMGAELTFATDWRWARRETLDIDWTFHGSAAGDSRVMVFPSDPSSDFEEASLMYHEVIASARNRIWIASPYFVPDRGIISALQLAALRGVDVRVMIPDRPDGPVVGMANWSFTRELLPAGVKIFRYEKAFLHQKVFLMDDTLAGVGTANFDNRSFRLNFEITVMVQDEAFCEEIRTMLENDFSMSYRVTQELIDSKPFWFSFAMGAARLLSPVL